MSTSNKIKITCDSICDLTPEIYEKYDITVLPLSVTIGDSSYKDGVDITLDKLFEKVSETGALSKTAAVSIHEYEEFFKKFTEQGMTFIHINISSGFSSCYQNACLAAEEVGNAYAIDSLNLSSGAGQLCIAAAQMAAEGKSAEDIVEAVNAMRDSVEVSFVIPTIEYLHKGGRCSSVAALGANLLKLKPCIQVIGGKMEVGKKYRGAIKKVFEEYAVERLKDRTDISPERIMVTHTLADREIVDMVTELVHKYHPDANVVETIAGCTVASHCGKGTLGLIMIKK